MKYFFYTVYNLQMTWFQGGIATSSGLGYEVGENLVRNWQFSYRLRLEAVYPAQDGRRSTWQPLHTMTTIVAPWTKKILKTAHCRKNWTLLKWRQLTYAKGCVQLHLHNIQDDQYC
jgi:hypothetical protein